MNQLIELITIITVTVTLITVYLAHRHLERITRQLAAIEAQQTDRHSEISQHIHYWDSERDELICQIELLEAVRDLLHAQRNQRPRQPSPPVQVKQERRTPGPSRRH